MEHLIRHRVTNDLSDDFKINVARRESRQVKPHWHDFYELELCIEGTGKSLINGVESRVVPGTLFFLTPTDYHSMEADDKFQIVNLTFAPYCIEYSDFSELLSLTQAVATTLKPEEMQKLLMLIDMIEQEGMSRQFLNQKYASHLLACIMIEILRIRRYKSMPEEAYNLPMQKLIYYIHSHFRENITLNTAAEFVGLSPGYVSKLFVKNLGIGFCELLTQLRLKQAENLLVHSGESITDIAFFCGFHSPSHFLRSFEQSYGVSPRQFRKNSQKS